jgi:probable addiction module antidote protein
LEALAAGIFPGLQGKEGNLMKRKASVSHDETIIRRLRNDPDFAAEYQKAALEDEDEPRVLLIALRHLAQAQGIAKVAGIERESLYRALSEHGNPRLSTRAEAYRRIRSMRAVTNPFLTSVLPCPSKPGTDIKSANLGKAQNVRDCSANRRK